MKAIEYIKSVINNLVQVYPSIQCSYELDVMDDSHTVEILPSVFFEFNSEFKEVENKVYSDFFRLYPYEALYFITNTSSLPIHNPIYVKSGVEYANISNITTITSNNYSNNITEKINIYSVNNLNFNFSNIKDNLSKNDINIQTANSLVQIAGEGNYALAA